jgi:hypothetical protein
MRLLIVIVNYRTPWLTMDCLDSIRDQVAALADTRVVVTDNLSPDDSVAVLAREIESRGYRDWVEFRPLPSNGGFAYGNNRAIETCWADHRPDYVLLLNPDTVVRDAGLSSLVAYMDKHPAVGIAGSRLEDPDGTPQRSAFRFPSLGSEVEGGLRWGVVSRLLTSAVVAPPQSDATVETGWVAGASMIVRREVFASIGFLDEAYFMYYEEVDFCLRARRAGFACHYVSASRVVHLVGQASGVTNKANARRRLPAYWFESRRRYFVKNHGWLYAAACDLLHALCFVLWRLRRWVQRKPDSDPDRFLGDFIRHSVFFSRALAWTNTHPPSSSSNPGRASGP